ncbi:hypothetical protein CH260_12715 [Rhodococcus sp. 05-2256-B2]|uniref:hypothetical protein n=1 Tax=unclassified Rhodococcus (in: high G+C Gram-positive bacteria) TaxID=192944 RepID=UPI000B9C0452|nr:MULTISPECIES: hypothetical protein [unclassified Rhodococcus (in: high G+C Gram-positive bacteria)]OZD82914.1 hypothetical protein CH258_18220 [Rhodococcus sp. 05-2256-B4]OZD96173.1 hypothetical protein CH260_12715 [Rhodococcus sp. 05-2256-B2]OZD96595.1 hypothetical protein CH257_04875 [Rhodococcus sp. 05-2256-B3]OZD99571.1 hypothetical protein CH285_20825 [Rhodococcus sp. 05-2256-B1]
MNATDTLHALTEAARAGHTVTATDLAAARAQVDAERTIDTLAEEGREERRLAAERQAVLDEREAAKATVRAGIAAAEAKVAKAYEDAADALSDLIDADEQYANKLREYRTLLSNSGLDTWNYYASMEQPPASEEFDPTIYVAEHAHGITVDGHPYNPVSADERLNQLMTQAKDAHR